MSSSVMSNMMQLLQSMNSNVNSKSDSVHNAFQPATTQLGEMFKTHNEEQQNLKEVASKATGRIDETINTLTDTKTELAGQTLNLERKLEIIIKDSNIQLRTEIDQLTQRLASCEHLSASRSTNPTSTSSTTTPTPTATRPATDQSALMAWQASLQGDKVVADRPGSCRLQAGDGLGSGKGRSVSATSSALASRTALSGAQDVEIGNLMRRKPDILTGNRGVPVQTEGNGNGNDENGSDDTPRVDGYIQKEWHEWMGYAFGDAQGAQQAARPVLPLPEAEVPPPPSFLGFPKVAPGLRTGTTLPDATTVHASTPTTLVGDAYLAAEMASLHAQCTKHKEKDKIGFPPFPKAGADALDWFDRSFDKIVDAGPNTSVVVKWAAAMRRATPEQLHDPGHYASLDFKIRVELLELIPKSTQLYHDVILLGRKMRDQDTRLSGRQLWGMVFDYFQEDKADRAVADMRRLDRCTMDGTKLEAFLNKWNTLLERLVKIPDEDYLFMRFRDQVSKLQHTQPRHYFHDYYFVWDNLPASDPKNN